MLLWRCEWNCVLFPFLSSVSLCEVQCEQRERGVDLTPAGDWDRASTTRLGQRSLLVEFCRWVRSPNVSNHIPNRIGSWIRWSHWLYAVVVVVVFCFVFSFTKQNFNPPMSQSNGFVLVTVSLTSGSGVSVPINRSHCFQLQQGALWV